MDSAAAHAPAKFTIIMDSGCSAAATPEAKTPTSTPTTPTAPAHAAREKGTAPVKGGAGGGASGGAGTKPHKGGAGGAGIRPRISQLAFPSHSTPREPKLPKDVWTARMNLFSSQLARIIFTLAVGPEIEFACANFLDDQKKGGSRCVPRPTVAMFNMADHRFHFQRAVAKKHGFTTVFNCFPPNTNAPDISPDMKYFAGALFRDDGSFTAITPVKDARDIVPGVSDTGVPLTLLILGKQRPFELPKGEKWDGLQQLRNDGITPVLDHLDLYASVIMADTPTPGATATPLFTFVHSLQVHHNTDGSKLYHNRIAAVWDLDAWTKFRRPRG